MANNNKLKTKVVNLKNGKYELRIETQPDTDGMSLQTLSETISSLTATPLNLFMIDSLPFLQNARNKKKRERFVLQSVFYVCNQPYPLSRSQVIRCLRL